LDFITTFNLLDSKECDFVRDFILEQEPKLKQLGPDVYPGTPSDSLTGRFRYYNLLDFDEIGNLFIPRLEKIFDQLNYKRPISVQCWANVFRKTESIRQHNHGKGFYSTHLFISGDESLGTTYVVDEKHYNVPNIPGALCVFPSELDHYSTPNIHEDKERITIAMDIIPRKILRSIENHQKYYLFK
jgi:hypothetical protein